MRAEVAGEPLTHQVSALRRCRASRSDGEGDSFSSASASAPAPAPGAALHSQERESGGGHLRPERRGAAQVDQGGAGAAAAALRGRQDERDPGPRQSHPRGQPQPPATFERDQRAEGEEGSVGGKG